MFQVWEVLLNLIILRHVQTYVQAGIFRMESTCGTCKGTGKIVSVWFKLPFFPFFPPLKLWILLYFMPVKNTLLVYCWPCVLLTWSHSMSGVSFPFLLNFFNKIIWLWCYVHHMQLIAMVVLITSGNGGENITNFFLCCWYQSYCKSCRGAKVIRGTKSVKLDIMPGNHYFKFWDALLHLLYKPCSYGVWR